MRKHGVGGDHPVTLTAACRLPKRERTSPCVTPFSDLAMCGNRIPGAFSVLRHTYVHTYSHPSIQAYTHTYTWVVAAVGRFFAYLKGYRTYGACCRCSSSRSSSRSIPSTSEGDTQAWKTHNLGTCPHPIRAWCLVASRSSSPACPPSACLPVCLSASLPLCRSTQPTSLSRVC